MPGEGCRELLGVTLVRRGHHCSDSLSCVGRTWNLCETKTVCKGGLRHQRPFVNKTRTLWETETVCEAS